MPRQPRTTRRETERRCESRASRRDRDPPRASRPGRPSTPPSLSRIRPSRWSDTCPSRDPFPCRGSDTSTSYGVGRQSLSRRYQLAKPCSNDVNATTQSADRKLTGSYEAVRGSAADPQQRCRAGHRQQERKLPEHVVLQFNSRPLYREVLSRTGLAALCLGTAPWTKDCRHGSVGLGDGDRARTFVLAFAAPRHWTRAHFGQCERQRLLKTAVCAAPTAFTRRGGFTLKGVGMHGCGRINFNQGNVIDTFVREMT